MTINQTPVQVFTKLQDDEVFERALARASGEVDQFGIWVTRDSMGRLQSPFLWSPTLQAEFSLETLDNPDFPLVLHLGGPRVSIHRLVWEEIA